MGYKFTVDEVEKDIYHVQMTSTKVLCKTFMRFQEHYESPRFRDQVFTREQFKKWYAGTRASLEYTYEEDWAGFNIPSYILEPFYNGAFDPLLQCEKDLIKLFEDKKDENFYIIGSANGNLDTMRHEIAHGLWYTVEEYYDKQLAIVKSIPMIKRVALKNMLLVMGYCDQVIDDETHAYLLTNYDSIKRRGLNLDGLDEIRQQLVDVYNEYSSYKIDINEKAEVVKPKATPKKVETKQTEESVDVDKYARLIEGSTIYTTGSFLDEFADYLNVDNIADD